MISPAKRQSIRDMNNVSSITRRTSFYSFVRRRLKRSAFCIGSSPSVKQSIFWHIILVLTREGDSDRGSRLESRIALLLGVSLDWWHFTRFLFQFRPLYDCQSDEFTAQLFPAIFSLSYPLRSASSDNILDSDRYLRSPCADLVVLSIILPCRHNNSNRQILKEFRGQSFSQLHTELYWSSSPDRRLLTQQASLDFNGFFGNSLLLLVIISTNWETRRFCFDIFIK